MINFDDYKVFPTLLIEAPGRKIILKCGWNLPTIYDFAFNLDKTPHYYDGTDILYPKSLRKYNSVEEFASLIQVDHCKIKCIGFWKPNNA